MNNLCKDALDGAEAGTERTYDVQSQLQCRNHYATESFRDGMRAIAAKAVSAFHSERCCRCCSCCDCCIHFSDAVALTSLHQHGRPPCSVVYCLDDDVLMLMLTLWLYRPAPTDYSGMSTFDVGL